MRVAKTTATTPPGEREEEEGVVEEEEEKEEEETRERRQGEEEEVSEREREAEQGEAPLSKTTRETEGVHTAPGTAVEATWPTKILSPSATAVRGLLQNHEVPCVDHAEADAFFMGAKAVQSPAPLMAQPKATNESHAARASAFTTSCTGGKFPEAGDSVKSLPHDTFPTCTALRTSAEELSRT